MEERQPNIRQIQHRPLISFVSILSYYYFVNVFHCFPKVPVSPRSQRHINLVMYGVSLCTNLSAYKQDEYTHYIHTYAYNLIKGTSVHNILMSESDRWWTVYRKLHK